MQSRMIEILRKSLREEKVVLEGHFPLRSGNHSNQYVSKDKICSDQMLFELTLSSLESKILDEHIECDVITGPALAGAVFAAPLARTFHKTFVYPEKVEERMEFRRGFDKILKGKRVLIVEDIITTGGSVIKTQKNIWDCGGKVSAIVCIWNRSSLNGMGDQIFNINGSFVYSLIQEPVEMWSPKDCPLCRAGVPLDDPKRM